MRVAVIGGKLQGTEAVYLAQKAGWEVLLIDKNPMVPAGGLCSNFCCADVTKIDEVAKVLRGVDIIIPALENQYALAGLQYCAEAVGVPLVYDAAAYSVSSSKKVSNKFFADMGVPIPIPWPNCGFPVIVKPSAASGSEGVLQIKNHQQFRYFNSRLGNQRDWVIEQYLEGPSYSIEVIGYAGKYKALQVTELEMDSDYDCKRVWAPALLSPSLVKQLEDIALTLAKGLSLNGIMDVEVILHDGALKVLEIDARLPSQTPTAVYMSTGINMFDILGTAFTGDVAWADLEIQESRGVVFEHLLVSPDKIEVAGEHIIAQAGPLKLYKNFYGADEVITDYVPGKTHWAATLIVTGADRAKAWEKRCAVISRIKEELHIPYYFDSLPLEFLSKIPEARSL